MGIISGHLQSLKSSDKKELERLKKYKRKSEELISWDLGKRLCALSFKINRNIGLVFDRRGSICEIVVGDAKSVSFPTIEGFRKGLVRMSGYSFIHTDLSKKGLTAKNRTDILVKRLDLLASIQIDAQALPAKVHAAHLHPNPELTQGLVELPPFRLDQDYPHIQELITTLEKDLIQNTSRSEDVHPDNQAIICALNTRDNVYFQQDIEELRELCRTAGLVVIDENVQKKDQAHAKYFLGKGKIEEVSTQAILQEADFLIFLQNLTAVQAAHIGELSGLKVLDRTQLILDIFAQRAQSYDGKVQVELAQLKYMLPRLREKESSLSRLVGGIGGRGPGETKLEVHRRRAHDRINKLEKELKDLARKRQSKRNLRQRKNLPIVSIVGYTNAGKSTLLNTLTKADALSENKLFATLDPFSKRLRFPQDREIILTDTVGFIRDLPKDLVQAFKATLEEIKDADLLLHVVDASSNHVYDNIDHVNGLLRELNLADIPQMIVLNKKDRVAPDVLEDLCMQTDGIAVSALDRKTCRPLLHIVEERVWNLKADAEQNAPADQDIWH